MRETQLRAFDAVARAGSFSDAAQDLGLTQPAVTIQVANLEKEFGMKLFARAQDGVQMTKAGADLFQLTRELAGVHDRINGFLNASRDLEAGELRLVADGPHLATRLIAAFREHHPGVTITLRLGNAQAAWRDLLEGRADAAIAADAPKDPHITSVDLQVGNLTALVSANHPLASRRKIPITALAGEPTILREPASNTRKNLERALRRASVSLGETLELGSREAVIEAVAAGLGMGFVFSTEITPDPRLRAIEIAGQTIANREVLGCLKSRRKLNAVNAVMTLGKTWPEDR